MAYCATNFSNHSSLVRTSESSDNAQSNSRSCVTRLGFFLNQTFSKFKTNSTKTFRNSICSTVNNEHGGTLIYNVFFVTTLFTTIGMFVNLGDIMTKKQLAQHVADTCAVSIGEMASSKPDNLDLLNNAALQPYLQLAGAQICQANLKAKGISTANLPWTKFNITTTSNGLGGNDGVQVSLAIPSGGIFSAFAHSATSMGASAQYRYVGGTQPIIASLVVDMSRSFVASDIVKKTDMRNAAKAFVEQLDLGDYVSIVSMSRHAVVHVPMVRIVSYVDEGATDQMTRTQINALIDTLDRPDEQQGTYAQGGLYFARKEIEKLQSKLSINSWNNYKKLIVVAGRELFNAIEQTYPTSYPINPFALCPNLTTNGERQGRAMAIQEADKARELGAEVFMVVSGGAGTVFALPASIREPYEQSFKRLTMDETWNKTNNNYWLAQLTPFSNGTMCAPDHNGAYNSQPQLSWAGSKRFHTSQSGSTDIWKYTAYTVLQVKGGRLVN